MWSRQKEAALAKGRLFKGYFSREKMLKSIYMPTWTNLWDEANKLIFNIDEFMPVFQQFLEKFKEVPTIEPGLPVTKFSDCEKYLFMFKVDYVTDIGLVDEFVGPIEQRFPELVYRAKTVDPSDEW